MNEELLVKDQLAQNLPWEHTYGNNKHFWASTGPFNPQKSRATLSSGSIAQTESWMSAFFPSMMPRLATGKAGTS